MVTCAEIMIWPLEKIEIFLIHNPNHIGAENALREVERQLKDKTHLNRWAKKHAIKPGWGHMKRKGKCPTKKSLR